MGLWVICEQRGVDDSLHFVRWIDLFDFRHKTKPIRPRN